MRAERRWRGLTILAALLPPLAATEALAGAPLTTWGVEERLTQTTTDSETGLNHGAIAVDATGTVHVVWAEQDGPRGNYQVYTRRHTAGAWGAAALVVPYRVESVGNLLGAKFPSLVCDRDDTLHLAWHDYRVAGINNAEIYYASCSASAAWDTSEAAELRLTTSQHPESGGDNSYVPTLTVDRHGDLDVVWYDFRYDGNAGEILTKRRRNDTWDTSPGDAADLTVAPSTGDSQFPAAVVDGWGHLHVAWQDDTAGNLRIRYARRDAVTGTFDPVQELTTAAQATAPALAVDGLGRIYAAWVDTRDGARRIYTRRRDPDGTWTMELPATPPGVNADEPALAVDAWGQAHLAWNDTRHGATNREILLQSIPPAGSWDDSGASDVRISNAAGSSTRASLATDGAGRVLIVWKDRRDGNNEIYARIGHSPPPVSAVDDVDAGSAPDARLLAWPNPARGGVTLALPHGPWRGIADGTTVCWQIYDAQGRLVRAHETVAEAGATPRWQWDGRDRNGAPLPAGGYWARVSGAGAEFRGRLVRVP